MATRGAIIRGKVSGSPSNFAENHVTELSIFEPRKTCPRCRRPEAVCYCDSVVSLPTQTRVVVLQHPREADVAINTARIAALCLPSSSVHVGVDFENDREVNELLSDPSRPPILLWPGEDARDLATDPPPSPVTLVVVDGTWWQARKLVKLNPRLASLPRYAFTPPRPSDYRIRREPAEHCVSTIEALALALGFLEGCEGGFEPMLAPFRTMVDRQIDCRDRIRASRHARKTHPDKPQGFPVLLHERREDLVIAVGEANGYPYDAEPRYREELVHLVAMRLSTGEVFDHFASTTAPLHPSTARHLLVPEPLLADAPPVGTLVEAWRSFLRPSDVICGWGTHTFRLLQETCGESSLARLDLRGTAGGLRRGAPGSMDEFGGWLGASPLASFGRGRAGQRAAELGGILTALLARG